MCTGKLGSTMDAVKHLSNVEREDSDDGVAGCGSDETKSGCCRHGGLYRYPGDIPARCKQADGNVHKRELARIDGEGFFF